MRNLRFTISYDGTSYSGFQSQPSGNTVQDHLERAIKMLTGEQVKLVSSGRTDAGVHARGQVVNFTTSSRIPVERWCLALNSRLPKDIVALQADEVPLMFNARKSAKRKTYVYTIRTTPFHDPFRHRFEFHHPRKLDTAAMQDALRHLIGTHDFTSFCTVRTDKEMRVRTIFDARLEVRPDLTGISDDPEGLLRVHISGSGFLYNMVRIIVGTLFQIGEGRRDSADMARILAGCDRRLAGPTAEAHGLMLWSVEYEE